MVPAKRIEQISRVFEGSGTMKLKVKSHMRWVPLPLMPKVKAELWRMEEQGNMERVTQPTD